MPDRNDCTLEIFDSSVFVEAVADTSGKGKEAKKVINSVKTADNRIPVAHQVIIGEVKDFLTSDYSFDDEVTRNMAKEEFENLLDGFVYVDLDLSDFIEALEFIRDEKGRIASEFNDSLIVGLAISSGQIDKIHTTDSWNLKEKSIKVNLI
ncbi:MAG: type II toxin-antitoxin system VapC family toxin [Candidatus Nanohalobium sp.]